jgi:PAS domain S-box-containing protein
MTASSKENIRAAAMLNGVQRTPGRPNPEASDARPAAASAAPFLLRTVLEARGTVQGSLAELLPVGVFCCDAEGRFVFYNRRAVRLWGGEPRLGCDEERYCAASRAWSPAGVEIARAERPVALALRAGRSLADCVLVLERGDGTRFAASFDVEILRDGEERVSGAIAVMRETSAPASMGDMRPAPAGDSRGGSRGEEFARVLDRVSQGLASLSDPDEMMQLAAREIGIALGVHRSSFPEWADDARHIVVRNDWFADGLASRAGTYDLATFGPEAWRERAREGSIAVDDVELDPDAQPFLPAFRAIGIRSYASARFRRGRTTTACLTVTAERPHRWTAEEMSLLDNALARTWPLIERARAEREMQDTVRRLTLAMKAARLGDWRWEAAGDVLTLSGRIAEIIGVASGTQLARSAFREYLHPEDREEARRITEAAIAAHTDYRMEYRLRRPSGDYAWVEATGSPLFGPTGEIVAAVGVMQEVTQRKEAEAELRARERALKLIGTHVPAVLSHWDRNNRLRFASRAFAARFGIEPEALLGKTVEEILGGEAFRALAPYVKRVLDGEPVEFEMEVPYERIGPRYVRASYVPEFGEQGEVRGYLVAVIDLTERRRTEVALRESEERLRMATQTGKIGVWDWDIVNNRVTWTDSLYSIHGVTPGEFGATAEAFASLVHPEDRAPVGRAIQSALEHDARYELEFRAVRPGGGIVWLFTNASVIRRDGRAVRMLGVTVDITARKTAELALRESEARFRTLASHAPVGIFLADPNGECVFVNESWREMTGLEPRKARGRGWVDSLHPEDRERVFAEWTAAVQDRRPFALEYRFRRPDGVVRWVEGGAVESRNRFGEVSGYIGTTVDITARKEVEERLRAHERQLRLISNNAPIILAHCDREERYRFVNRAYLEHFGMEMDQVVGRTVEDVVGPAARKALEPHIRRVLAGETFEFEIEVVYRSIGRRVMRVAYTPEFGSEGEVIGWLAAITDDTERRRILDALRESEERFRQLADSMPQIVFATDPQGKPDYFNRRWYEFTGLPAAGAAAEGVLPMLHAGDVAWFHESWRRSVNTGRNYEAEYRLRHAATGVYRWQLARALPILSASGEIVRWFGTFTDIHDWKLVQDELRRRTSSLEALHRVGTTLAAERDLEKIVACVAEAGREVTGAEAVLFFYDVRSSGGEKRTRCTVVGRAAFRFEETSPPAADLLLGPAAKGEGFYRIDDAAAESHWTLGLPFASMPGPVRSYLAVPVVSRDGVAIGGLCLARSEPCGFSDDHVRTVTGIAAHAAIAIDNANLYSALSHELRQKTQTEEELSVAQEQLRAHAAELEQRVGERTASLREAIAQMEEFSYSVSHDLRAPLRAMNAYAQALAEDYGTRLDDTGREYLERIRRSSQRMERLTHDVLTYSRVAQSDVELREIELATLLRDVIGHYSELQPATADVTVVQPLIRVRAHESSLGQCLGNLLTNAAKFVDRGVRPKIRIWTELRGDRVRLWVEDNGIGIAPHHQTNLFRVFERAPTRLSYEGTGIGLAIVRKAVEKMGGRAGVESDGANGSRFWIELLPAQP